MLTIIHSTCQVSIYKIPIYAKETEKGARFVVALYLTCYIYILIVNF